MKTEKHIPKKNLTGDDEREHRKIGTFPALWREKNARVSVGVLKSPVALYSAFSGIIFFFAKNRSTALPYNYSVVLFSTAAGVSRCA